MIETALIRYLNDKLNVEAYAEYPEDAPAQFVIMEKTGSGISDRLSRATIALQSYADTLIDAMKLNEQVKEAMDELPWEVDSVTRSKLNSDYNFTDTSTRKYRYQAVYDITYYKEDV